MHHVRGAMEVDESCFGRPLGHRPHGNDLLLLGLRHSSRFTAALEANAEPLQLYQPFPTAWHKRLLIPNRQLWHKAEAWAWSTWKNWLTHTHNSTTHIQIMQAEGNITLSVTASDGSFVVTSQRTSEAQYLMKKDSISSAASTDSESEDEQYEPVSQRDAKARSRKRRVWGSGEVASMALLHCALGNKWSLIARHIRGRRDNDCKNIFHSALRSKTNETSALLRVYAQAVGPNCDDSRVRQAAYQAALRQVGGVEPPARIVSCAAHYMELAAEEARGGSEGGGQLTKALRSVTMAAEDVEAYGQSPGETSSLGNSTRAKRRASTAQQSFAPPANTGPTPTTTAAGSPLPNPFLSPNPAITPSSAAASAAKAPPQLAASSACITLHDPPGNPLAASLPSRWKTLFNNTIAASPFANTSMQMAVDGGAYPLGGGGVITESTTARSFGLQHLLMKRSASKDLPRDLAASGVYYLAGDDNTVMAAAPSPAAHKTATAWPVKHARMAACSPSDGRGSDFVMRLARPWALTDTVAAAATAEDMKDAAAVGLVVRQVVLGMERFEGGGGCQQVAPQKQKQQQTQQGRQHLRHTPPPPLPPPPPPPPPQQQQQQWQWQQRARVDPTRDSISASPDLALQELDIAMAEAEGGPVRGLGDGDGGGGGGWGTSWGPSGGHAKHGTLGAGSSKPVEEYCSRSHTVRQVDPVEEVFPSMEWVNWRTQGCGMGGHPHDASLRGSVRADRGCGDYDAALMRLGGDAGGFGVATETGMGQQYGRQYDDWRCWPQPLVGESDVTAGTRGVTAATLLLDAGVGVPAAAGNGERGEILGGGSLVLSSVGSAAADSSMFWSSRFLNTSVDQLPSTAPTHTHQPVWSWSTSSPPVLDASTTTARAAMMAHAASVNTSPPPPQQQQQQHLPQPLQLQQPQTQLQHTQRPHLIGTQQQHQQLPTTNMHQHRQQQQQQFRTVSAAAHHQGHQQQPVRSGGPIWTAFSRPPPQPTLHHMQQQRPQQYTKTQQQLQTQLQMQAAKEALLGNVGSVRYNDNRLRPLGQQVLDVGYCHLLGPGESLDDLMVDLLG